MAIESNEETPAIIALRARLKELDKGREWEEGNREYGRQVVEAANAALVEIAGETDSIEAALKTLVAAGKRAANIEALRRESLISDKRAVDLLGGVL